MRPDERAIARLDAVLRSVGVARYALTGGTAFGVWCGPRQTRDVDVVADVPLAAVDPLLAFHDGMRFGPEELPDILRIDVAGWDVDLFVVKREVDVGALERSRPVEFGGVLVHVVVPEDLVAQKLRKLHTDRRRILQDLQDLRALVALPLDWALLQSLVPAESLPLLELARTATDDDLLRRLS